MFNAVTDIIKKTITKHATTTSNNYLLLRPGRGEEYCDQPVCLSVCASVCLRAYLWNLWNDRREILCADPL